MEERTAKPICTIQGLGSCGKTATIKEIIQYLSDHRFHSTGAIARAMADEYNMHIKDFNLYARAHNIPFDSILDDSLKKLNESNEKWIVDSRLAYFFIPSSFKVFLTVDPIIAAQRRLAQLQKEDAEKYAHLTIEMVQKDLTDRNQDDVDTYIKLYNTNCSDHKNFDLIVDTSYLKVHQVATEIILKYSKWLRNNGL